MKPCRKCGAIDRYKSGACRPCSNVYYSTNFKKIRIAGDIYQARYRAENPEQVKATKAKYYAGNSKKAKAASAKWRTKNPEKMKVAGAKWRAENHGLCRINAHNRNARKKANGGMLSKGLSENLFKRQKGKCACCQEPLGDNYHLDHIIPLSLGGANEDWNIQLLTATCNLKKGSKHPIDYMRSKGLAL